MNCERFEERMSDFIENAMAASERTAMQAHVQGCRNCPELLQHMAEIVEWGRNFEVFEAPAWLPARIIANTPRTVRETWRDTLAAGWRWVFAPRIAMAMFTAVLMLGWMGSHFGLAPAAAAIVQDPRSAYGAAGELAIEAYDQAIRRYYSAPLVTRIQSRIEQFREIS